MKKFVLASASPRRREILMKEGFNFDVIPSNVEETGFEDLPPYLYAKALAELKSKDVYGKVMRPALGADTVVAIDGKILGKPADRSENEAFLRLLSGKVHHVYTGFALTVDGETTSGYADTSVEFFQLSDEVINAYLDSGSGLDKAGGYGIQDGFSLVKKIEGSFTNVVGLPIEDVKKLLELL